ncbi:hypothetical protein O6H91_01G033700 [Diphasiastrum complanatum]|uniref:Uncharacterized protein n=4 Tax=Diphasiastrum complanatum TaxID=34168 RepID=A0ACC2EPN3_DIPCM|nr:hypothetical protein O6H91_01G033700 [Diphasiastrum complanatum]KAJ7568469.1 hypothetical protein O6H91_01G033700 [Diphasiastrum complanatum]KAJ7568470.1 hypothetical protein O6H91_01G033700 [Diphasiastrum complanatum]KAJ7568471.1 hypothetical protein O6H91_01G033700 [Diphasiastrum complanatum]
MAEELLDRRTIFVEPEKIARRYQLEVLERALSHNTIIYLETGCGKTLIAVLLIRALSHLFRKPEKGICVFLVPSICICKQQAEYIKFHTDLHVGQYYGTGIPVSSDQKWTEELKKYEVFVMTPEILLRTLRHCFIKKENIKLLIFDECHHAGKNHPYAIIMKEFYHDHLGESPRIFGMTASPITGKGNSASGPLVYKRAIEELESTLNAKIYTVKEKAEVDMYMPSPKLQVIYYNRLSPTTTLSEKLYLLQREHTQRQWTFASLVGQNNSEPSPIVSKEKVRIIHKLYSSLEYFLKELGLWCAEKAAHCFLKDEEKDLQVGSEGCVPTDDCKVAFLHDALRLLNSALMQDLSVIQDDDWSDGSSLISTKVQTLLCLLQSYKKIMGLKCIVFVERILTTHLLMLLLGQMPNFAFLKCESLAGHRSSYGRKSHANQQEVIKEFRSSELNLLVATNVAEEGLDIQTCCLVIRFDIPKTEHSFIQSKGRARQRGSDYIVLIEAGNENQESWLQSVVKGETLLQEQAQQSSELTTVKAFLQINDNEPYTVGSTGATVNLDSSVSLLHHYCAKLPGQRLYELRPQFSYYTDDEGVICTVKLPGSEPVCKVTGHRCETPSLAKRAACLEACRRLHYAGALTDYLIPVSKTDVDTACLASQRSSKQENKQDMDTFETLVPDALRGNWDASCGKIVLHAYLLSFTSEPADREYASFYLLLQSELNTAAETMPLELTLGQGPGVVASLRPSGRVEFDEHEIELAKTFQKKLFSMVFDWKTGSSLLEALPTDSANSWDCSKMYLLLPQLHKHGVTDSSDISIDWNMIRIVSLPVSSLAGFNASIDDSLVQENESMLQFADGSLPAKLALNAFVVTGHNGRPYCVAEVMQGVNADSVFKPRPSEYKSYVDYFLKRYNKVVRYPHQPLLRAKHLSGLQNFLIEHPSGTKPKVDATVELPPDICILKLVGVSSSVVNATTLVPSCMHRIENFFIAVQLQNKLAAAFEEGGQISSTTVLKALTTSKCTEKFSLESLEMLGDSCLKFAVTQHLFLIHADEDEGKLSCRRASEISNNNLYRLGLAKDIPVHIRDGMFNPDEWQAPGRVVHETRPLEDSQSGCYEVVTRCTKRYHQIKKKTVADVVEALIGGFVVDSGLKAAIAFMQWLGLQVHVDPSLLAKIYNYSEPSTLNQKIEFVEVERILGYSFQKKNLLVEALTHPSYHDSKSNYQRLEFLGDAVLDFLMARHLYLSFPGLKPGLLSDLKSATVNNWSLSLVAMRYGLHRFLLESTAQLMPCIEKFLSESQSSQRWEDDGAPKVLSDIVESLAGAIFLDTGFSVSKVWIIFEPLLQPIVSPETLQIHPVRELHELCQFHGFDLSYTNEILNAQEKRFTAKVEMQGTNNVVAIVNSPINLRKKVSKLRAAKDVLEKLKIQGWIHPCHKLASALKKTGLLENSTSFKQELWNSGLLINNELSKLEFPIKADFGSRLDSCTSLLRKESCKEATGSSKHQSCESYSFLNDFNSCNHVQITPKDQPKTTYICDVKVSHQPSDVTHSSPPNTIKYAPEGTMVFKEEPCSNHFVIDHEPFGASPLYDESSLEGAFSSLQNLSINCKSNSRLSNQLSNESKSSSVHPLLGSDLRTTNHTQKHEMASIVELLRLRAANNEAWISRTKADTLDSQGPPRSKLYEFCARNNWRDPLFTCCNEQGPPHLKIFTFSVTITLPEEKHMEFSGEPMRDHKAAKDSAASCALIWLKDNFARLLQ